MTLSTPEAAPSLPELRALAMAADAGLWRNDGRYVGSGHAKANIAECMDHSGCWSDSREAVANARFIAAANPAAVLALCDRVERLEAAAKAVLDAYQVKGRPNEKLWPAVRALVEALK